MRQRCLEEQALRFSSLAFVISADSAVGQTMLKGIGGLGEGGTAVSVHFNLVFIHAGTRPDRGICRDITG